MKTLRENSTDFDVLTFSILVIELRSAGTKIADIPSNLDYCSTPPVGVLYTKTNYDTNNAPSNGDLTAR